MWRSTSMLMASAAVTCTLDLGPPKGSGPGAIVAAAFGRGASPGEGVPDFSVGLWVVGAPLSGAEPVPVAVGAAEPGDGDGVRDDEPVRAVLVSANSVVAPVETLPLTTSSVLALVPKVLALVEKVPLALPLVRRLLGTGCAVCAARMADSSMILIRRLFSASMTSLSLLHSPFTSLSVSHFRSSASGKRSASS